jgi:hypothetical protein
LFVTPKGSFAKPRVLVPKVERLLPSNVIDKLEAVD